MSSTVSRHACSCSAAASVDSDDDDQIDEVDDVQGKYELHILNSITCFLYTQKQQLSKNKHGRHSRRHF